MSLAVETSDSSLLVEELTPAPAAEEIFLRLRHLPHCLFLDSALRDPALGRYSFVAADPFDVLRVPADGSDALGELARRMAGFAVKTVPGLPPFQGGAAGLFGYDLGHSLEKLPRPAVDEFQVPALAVGFYDVVVAVDHEQERAWIISQGLPAVDPGQRRRRAAERLTQFRHRLKKGSGLFFGKPGAPLPGKFGEKDSRPLLQHPVAETHGRYPDGPYPDGLTSNFTEADYLQTVERAIEYIYAGDVFQVNLAQRLLYPARDDSATLYLRLRRCNPAPFAGYFDLGDFQIVSASPERFLKVFDDGNGQPWVETRPIKGTRRRSGDRQTDRLAESELRQSEKDRAENVMIVDLLRNDLSRVCLPESVQVSQLCRLESYQYVLHLVSAVCGRLREGCTPVELIRAAFPGGSITGAPKVRAMEIIAELEGVARGAYCGSLGYLGFDGSMDLSILIRTITAGRGWWQVPVGGGIVAQSVPEQEYEETWHKAEGLIRALAVKG